MTQCCDKGVRMKCICTESITFRDTTETPACTKFGLQFKENPDAGPCFICLHLPSKVADAGQYLASLPVFIGNTFDNVQETDWVTPIKENSFCLPQQWICGSMTDCVIGELPWNSSSGGFNEHHCNVMISTIVKKAGGTGDITISLDLPDGGTLSITEAVTAGDMNVAISGTMDITVPVATDVQILELKVTTDFDDTCDDTQLTCTIVNFRGAQSSVKSDGTLLVPADILTPGPPC